jgi:selenide,water dikinase
MASVDAAAVPLLEGALECTAAGHLSSLHPENARVAALLDGGLGGTNPALFAALVDPQTAGGLLASVPAGHASSCVAALREAGYQHAAVVGCVVDSLPASSSACLRLADGSAV